MGPAPPQFQEEAELCVSSGPGPVFIFTDWLSGEGGERGSGEKDTDDEERRGGEEGFEISFRVSYQGQRGQEQIRWSSFFPLNR